MPRPKKYDDATRDQLITATAAAIYTGGPDSVSLRAVAADAGCTTSTIYSLFGSRDGLVEAVAAHVSASFTASQVAVPRTESPLDDLTKLGHAYRDWALAHPTYYAVMFGSGSRAADCAPYSIPDDDSIQPLIDAVTRAFEAGLLDGAPVPQMVLSIWAGVHGWATLELAGATPAGPRKAKAAYAVHLRSLINAWRP